MPLDAKLVGQLKGLVDEACADTAAGLPGATVVLVDKTGEELFAHSAGLKSVSSPEPMTLDTTFWIASCTKVVTGIACMQLVEKGLLRLDDADHLEKLCPELKDVQVLKTDGTFEPKNKQITLRMLLTHTAGFSYGFFHEKLRDWNAANNTDEFSGGFAGLRGPLVFQPGEDWGYGTNIDWAGVALERASGLTLNAYMQEHIFKPLGVRDVSMVPDASMRARLATMHHRAPDGTLSAGRHLLRAPLEVDLNDEKAVAEVFGYGGAGLFAEPREYCKILAMLLNDGACPRTGTRLLRKETVDEMFTNQIPQFPDFGRRSIPAVMPELANPISEMYPVPGNPPQGWGITFMLSNGGATGRSKGTAHWAGLPNLWYWVDREAGIAGMVATQILPFGDGKVLDLWGKVEATSYSGR